MNGFAEASYTLTAALSILAMNTFNINWQKWGEAALVLISTIDAIVLVIYAQTQSIYVMYGCYIVYRSLFQVMVSPFRTHFCNLLLLIFTLFKCLLFSLILDHNCSIQHCSIDGLRELWSSLWVQHSHFVDSPKCSYSCRHRR